MRIISSLCLLLVVASGALAQRTPVIFNPGGSFKPVRTYAWGPCEDPGELRFWGPAIIQNIEFQLAARGFRRALPGQQPDVIVSYHAVLKERALYAGYEYAYGPNWGPSPALNWGPSWGWNWTWSGGPVAVDPIIEREFELTVELVDARRNLPLWSGDASERLSSKSVKNDKRLRKAVARIFRDYP
jgi:hypothetical protein